MHLRAGVLDGLDQAAAVYAGLSGLVTLSYAAGFALHRPHLKGNVLCEMARHWLCYCRGCHRVQHFCCACPSRAGGEPGSELADGNTSKHREY